VLQLIDLAFGFGEKPLYQGVNFIVGRGQKVGLIGPNGSGKSTLLSIIRGEEDGYTGKIKLLGHATLVPQEIKYDPDMEKALTIKNYVNSTNTLQDHEIHKMFKGLELNVDLDSDPKTLSGGQKTKLALARALLTNPDILLLDEPTNFMDKSGKDWVMRFLTDYQGTVIVISHDLELMDKAIDKVLAITPHNSSVEEYKGTYSDYVRLKRQKEENLRKERLVKEKHLKRMKEDYLRMAQYDSKKSVRRRQIEREKLALPEIPPEIKKISIRLPEPKKVGEIPMRTVGVSKSYGDLKVLDNLNFTIVRHERIALIGSNGTGKSTFIKILMGMVKPDLGEVIGSPELSIGYYSQEFETFDFTKTVIETFCGKTQKDEGFARGFLARFLFLGNKVFQSVGSLSGGEKTRLSIACLMGKDNNLLVLDEPTTYLDLLSQRVILESLKEYKGTMIVVSHTAEFIKELAPQKAFLFPEQKMVFWDDVLFDRIMEI